MQTKQMLLGWRIVFANGSTVDFKPSQRHEAIETFEGGSAALPVRLLRLYGEEMRSRGATRGTVSRDELNAKLLKLYRPYMTAFPQVSFVAILEERYGAGETRLLSVDQLADLVQYVEDTLAAAVK